MMDLFGIGIWQCYELVIPLLGISKQKSLLFSLDLGLLVYFSFSQFKLHQLYGKTQLMHVGPYFYAK